MVRVRVWVKILGRASVRVRIKDKKSMSRGNFLWFDLVISSWNSGILLAQFGCLGEGFSISYNKFTYMIVNNFRCLNLPLMVYDFFSRCQQNISNKSSLIAMRLLFCFLIIENLPDAEKSKTTVINQ